MEDAKNPNIVAALTGEDAQARLNRARAAEKSAFYLVGKASGIERGKLEEVKNKDGVKELVFTPNASSTRWAVKHMGKTVTSSQLFNPEIFTQEVLQQLDEKVIKPHFLLPAMGTAEEITDALEAEMDEDFVADGQK